MGEKATQKKPRGSGIDYGDSDDDDRPSKETTTRKRSHIPGRPGPAKIAKIVEEQPLLSSLPVTPNSAAAADDVILHSPRFVSASQTSISSSGIILEPLPLLPTLKLAATTDVAAVADADDELKQAASECLSQEIAKEKNSLEKIELSDEAVVNLRENVKKLLSYRHAKGRSIIHHIGESPQFQNPYCLEAIMSAFKINPYSSNFPSFIYDPEAVEVFEGARFAKFQMVTKTSQTKTSNAQQQPATTDKTQTTTAAAANSKLPTTAGRRLNKWDVKKK